MMYQGQNRVQMYPVTRLSTEHWDWVQLLWSSRAVRWLPRVKLIWLSSRGVQSCGLEQAAELTLRRAHKDLGACHSSYQKPLILLLVVFLPEMQFCHSEKKSKTNKIISSNKVLGYNNLGLSAAVSEFRVCSSLYLSEDGSMRKIFIVQELWNILP